jgi:hypothetical protein
VHAEGRNKNKKYMLKEGKKQEVQAEGRNTNKRHIQKDGLKTRSTC